jgi:hypothetical protein
MMDILGIVTLATIRSTLGMSETDASDSVIANLNLQDEVEIDLQSWLPDFQAVIDDTWSAQSADVREFVFLRLKAFVKYYASAVLAESAPGLLLRRISDGENEAQRFDSVNPTKLAGNLYQKADQFRQSIVDKLEPLSAGTFPLFGVVNPSYDPVTGE